MEWLGCQNFLTVRNELRKGISVGVVVCISLLKWIKNNKTRDESDEDGCKTIVMKENYSKAIAPFIFDAEKDENLPARVNVSLSVIDVVNIKEVDHTYNLKFKLRLQWFDYR